MFFRHHAGDAAVGLDRKAGRTAALTLDILTVGVAENDAGNRGFRIYHTRRDYARSCTLYDMREENIRKDIETVYDAVFLRWGKPPEEEQKTFERLSLRFPDGCWPRLVSKRCGCLTSVPFGSDEYETMEDCLQHFKAQLDAMRESGELA